MQIENRKIASLKLYDANPKRHPDNQIELLKKSITEFGWTTPLLVDSDGVVIAGHGRLEAARQLGVKEAPVVQIDDLTPEQVRAYRIADNKLTELGGWDRTVLATELEALRDMDFDFEITGFDADFLNSLTIDEEAVTRGDQPEPWEDDNPVIATATANEIPMATIRFLTDEARDAFFAWLETMDHSIVRHREKSSIYMPARAREAYADEADE